MPQPDVVIDAQPTSASSTPRFPTVFERTFTISFRCDVKKLLTWNEFNDLLREATQAGADEFKQRYAPSLAEDLEKENLLDLTTFPPRKRQTPPR